MSTLAVIAALVIGVNIGRKFQTSEVRSLASPTPSLSPTKQQEASFSATKTYRSTYCNVAFDYPGTYTLLDSASGSAAFTGPAADDGILLTCRKDIPRPSISAQNIEDIRIGSVSAKLYNKQTLIFRHPKIKLDVFLAGTGEVFQKIISSLTLL